MTQSKTADAESEGVVESTDEAGMPYLLLSICLIPVT